MKYKLWRVQVISDWTFVVAENEETAIKMVVEHLSYDPREDYPNHTIPVVEYSLDKPYILPSGWQSEQYIEAG